MKHKPLRIYFTFFGSLAVKFCVLLTAGGVTRYLQPKQVAQGLQLLQDGGASLNAICEGLLCLSAQPQECEEILGKWALHDESWTGAVEEHQPSRRTNICSFVEGGAEEHCQSSTKWLPACFWQNCQSQTPWVRHQGLTSFSGTDTQSPAPWSSIGICLRTPEQADPPMAPRAGSHRAHVTNATLSADVLISVIMRQIDLVPDRRDLSCNTELPEFILEGLWHDFICVPVCSWYSLKTEVDWLWVDRWSSGYVPFRCFQSLASGEIGCLRC